MVKAIETEYNGYRFRSRLEARWAVFFDEAGIPYEYEKEGFEDENGTRYLPDFYLPWFKAYVEIKPSGFHDNESAFNEAVKKIALPFKSQDCVVILCEGEPAEENMVVWCQEVDDGGGGIVSESCAFREGVQGVEVVDDGEGPYESEFMHTKHWISLVVGNSIKDRDREYLTSGFNHFGAVQFKKVTGYRNDFEDAAIKARAARFEFGESGAKQGKKAQRPRVTKAEIMDWAQKKHPGLFVLLRICEVTIDPTNAVTIIATDNFARQALKAGEPLIADRFRTTVTILPFSREKGRALDTLVSIDQNLPDVEGYTDKEKAAIEAACRKRIEKEDMLEKLHLLEMIEPFGMPEAKDQMVREIISLEEQIRRLA